MLFPSAFFHVSVFSGLLFCSWVIGFLSWFSLWLKYLHSFTRTSLPHSRWVPDLELAQVSTDLGSQKWSRGAHGTKISIQISALAGFWHRTSHSAVQNTTSRSPCTHYMDYFLKLALHLVKFQPISPSLLGQCVISCIWPSHSILLKTAVVSMPAQIPSWLSWLWVHQTLYVTDFFEISRISRFMKGLKSASEVGKFILSHFWHFCIND